MLTSEVTGVILLILRVAILAATIPLLKALNREGNYAAVTFWFTMISGFLAMPVVIYQAMGDPAYFAGATGWLDNAAGSALFFTVGMVAFMWALGRGDSNLLAPLLALAIVFIYVFDLFRGVAAVNLMVIGGIALTTIGVALLNIKPGVRLSTVLNPLAVLLQAGASGAVFYAVALAFIRIIDSQGVVDAPKFAYSMLANWFVALFCILLILIQRRWNTLKTAWRDQRNLLIVFSLIGVVNYTTLLFLYDHYLPSIIEPVSQISIIFVVLYGWIYFKEPLYWRWLAAIFVIAGVSLVLLNSGTVTVQP